MFAPTKSLVAFAAAACFLAASARADVLLLNNGDHLTGKVIKRKDDKVYFHSDVFGDIVAPANLVTVSEGTPSSPPSESLAGLPPQPPVKTLTPPSSATATHPSPKSGLPSPPASPGTAQQAGQPIVLTPYQGAAPPRSRPWLIAKPLQILAMFKPWTGKIEAGYDNEVTNIRTVNINLRAEAERTIGPDSFQANERYLYGFTGNTATADQNYVDFRWRHQLDERLFAQSLTSLNHDKLQELHEDLDEDVGLGYKIFQSVSQTVDIGAGVIGQYLDVGGFQKGYDVLGNIFQDYTYKINGRYTFTEDASADFSPQERARFGLANGQVGSLATQSGRTQNYSYKLHATLQGKITERLSLNLHFEYQYYSAILDPATRADQHIITTLGYSF